MRAANLKLEIDEEEVAEPGYLSLAGDVVVQELLAEFNEDVRCQATLPNFDHYLSRCPEEHQKELTSLMNVVALAHHALKPHHSDKQRERPSARGTKK